MLLGTVRPLQPANAELAHVVLLLLGRQKHRVGSL